MGTSMIASPHCRRRGLCLMEVHWTTIALHNFNFFPQARIRT